MKHKLMIICISFLFVLPWSSACMANLITCGTPLGAWCTQHNTREECLQCCKINIPLLKKGIVDPSCTVVSEIPRANKQQAISDFSKRCETSFGVMIKTINKNSRKNSTVTICYDDKYTHM